MEKVITGVRHLSKFKTKSLLKERKTRLLAIISGIAIGAVNGLFGAGGGMLVVPVLTYLFGLNVKKSHATAIMIILPLCAVSAVVYGLKGSYDYSIFPATVIGVVAGGILGALALKKANNVFIRFLFYGLMMLAGFKMIF